MTHGCSWEPEAYKGVELRKHNTAVGAAVKVLFGERLSGSGMVASKFDETIGHGSLALASILAGATHDMGKASPYYKDRGSFPGHEIVGASLLHRAGGILIERLGAEASGLAVILELAAWAVARHHSAMKDRHPSSLSDRFKKQAIKALQGLIEEPECLIRGIPKPLADSWFSELLLEAIKTDNENPRGFIGEALNSLKAYGGIVKHVRIPDSRWIAYVSMASGAVIVADILVASYEGRRTDDEVVPDYAEWWKRELGSRANRVEELAKNAKEAEETLKDAIKPLTERNITL